MIKIHDKALRGHTRTGWLDSFHTFSFGSFNDPTRMGFGNLRVINDDRIIPGSGFARHRHADMDILTYVLTGKLRHEDDQGNVSVISTGEAQLMSAGRGVEHAEWNASNEDDARFLQIWMIPDAAGGDPAYAQSPVPDGENVLLAGPEDAALTLRSGTKIRLIRATEGKHMPLGAGDAQIYAHLIDGLAHADGERVSAGDGLQIPAGEDTTLEWSTEGAALIFQMPSVQATGANPRPMQF